MSYLSAMVALPRSLQMQLVDCGRELSLRGCSCRRKAGSGAGGFPELGFGTWICSAQTRGAALQEPSPAPAVLGLALQLNTAPPDKLLSLKASFYRKNSPFAPRRCDIFQAKSRALLTRVCKSKERSKKILTLRNLLSILPEEHLAKLSCFQGEKGSTGPSGENGTDGLPGPKVNQSLSWQAGHSADGAGGSKGIDFGILN